MTSLRVAESIHGDKKPRKVRNIWRLRWVFETLEYFLLPSSNKAGERF